MTVIKPLVVSMVANVANGGTKTRHFERFAAADLLISPRTPKQEREVAATWESRTGDDVAIMTIRAHRQSDRIGHTASAQCPRPS